MNICKHEIDPKQIIGIGPLMNEWFNGGDNSIYRRQRKSFKLHCKKQSISIESDIVETENCPESYLDKMKACLAEFEKGYDDARGKVLSLFMNTPSLIADDIH